MRTDAHKRYLWRFAHGILIVGVAFFVLSFLSPAAMTSHQYGAKAGAIPAGIWALGFIAASGLVIFGLHINGRAPRLTPLIRLFGLGFLLMQFVILSLSAWSARDGATVVIFSACFFVPHLMHFICADARLLKTRWGSIRDDT